MNFDLGPTLGLLGPQSPQNQPVPSNGLLGYAQQMQQLQQKMPQAPMQQMQPMQQMPQSLPSQTMGPWSQLAYQMAGSPHQGGLLPSVAPPSAIPGSLPGSASGGSSGGIGTSILTGLLGAVAKNPSLVSSAYHGITGLLGGSAPSVLAGGSPALSSIGTGAVAPAVDSAAADASSALAGTPSVAATGGLLAAAPAASSAASALGAGAPGLFASGGPAAASGASAGAGAGTLGAAGTAAVVAAPFIAQQLGLMLGDAWTGKNTQGNAAMQGWMNASGAKWVPNPGQSGSGGNTFQSQQFSTAKNPGTIIGPNGQPMTPSQAVNAISAWAAQNGVNPGDFHPVG